MGHTLTKQKRQNEIALEAENQEMKDVLIAIREEATCERDYPHHIVHNIISILEKHYKTQWREWS